VGKPFQEYKYDDARSLFSQVPQLPGLAGQLVSQGATPRRPPSAVAATLFHQGDHWQNTAGFIGQLPVSGYPGAATITADIKARFESENVIKEVIETHIGGLLGREPLWSFLKEEGTPGQKTKEKDEITGETLTPWWNEREALNDLQKSAETVLLEGIAVKRVFIPKGLVPDGVIPKLPDINRALDYIFFETKTADVAGVFIDPDTQKKIGVYLFEEKDANGDVTANCAELSFLNEKNETICRVVRDKGKDSEDIIYQLGGRLLVFEMQRPPLITEQVQSNQKALNLAHTMMTRNVNMAGSRERSVTNAQPPRRPVRVQSKSNPREITETVPGDYETGAGAVMFLMGYPIRNEKGDIIGYTNPGVHVTDPAQVDVFVHTRDMKYAAILGQCHQRHVLIQGDATASGVSRKQAEKEWQRSLKDTKTVVDAAGRWQLEVTLRLAAQLVGQTPAYLNLRADFNCLLDVGEPEPDDIRVVMEMRKPGGPNNTPLISDETARNKVGIDDAAAELERIEAEAPAEPITPQVEDPNLLSDGGQQEELGPGKEVIQ
jgi:hypothetical protein